jgi:hypothetical protein
MSSVEVYITSDTYTDTNNPIRNYCHSYIFFVKKVDNEDKVVILQCNYKKRGSSGWDIFDITILSQIINNIMGTVTDKNFKSIDKNYITGEFIYLIHLLGFNLQEINDDKKNIADSILRKVTTEKNPNIFDKFINDSPNFKNMVNIQQLNNKNIDCSINTLEFDLDSIIKNNNVIGYYTIKNSVIPRPYGFISGDNKKDLILFLFEPYNGIFNSSYLPFATSKFLFVSL